MHRIPAIKKAVEDIKMGARLIPITKWMPINEYNTARIIDEEELRLNGLGCYTRIEGSADGKKIRLVRSFDLDELEQYKEIEPIISQPSNNNNSLTKRLTKKQYNFLLWIESLVI